MGLDHSVTKSVLRYELDKFRYLDLETVVIPVLFSYGEFGDIYKVLEIKSYFQRFKILL